MTSRAPLTLRKDFWGDPVATAAYAALMREVFDLDVLAGDRLCGHDSTCRPLAFFDADRACVASVESFDLPLVLDGLRCKASGIRLVAVAPSWRGRGLFRTLVADLLARLETDLTLLYAEHLTLYAPFGFHPLQQHKSIGPTPLAASASSTSTRRLTLDSDEDVALLRHLLARRLPISNAVAVDGGASLFLARAGEYRLTYCSALDAVIVSDDDAEAFTLVDVVAAQIPTLAEVIGALRPESETTEVLFPTDKLDWHATSVPDDSGLMLRGPEPAAFRNGFMLPPTTEF